MAARRARRRRTTEPGATERGTTEPSAAMESLSEARGTIRRGKGKRLRMRRLTTAFSGTSHRRDALKAAAESGGEGPTPPSTDRGSRSPPNLQRSHRSRRKTPNVCPRRGGVCRPPGRKPTGALERPSARAFSPTPRSPHRLRRGAALTACRRLCPRNQPAKWHEPGQLAHFGRDCGRFLRSGLCTVHAVWKLGPALHRVAGRSEPPLDGAPLPRQRRCCAHLCDR